LILTASHDSGIEALEEIKDKLPLKVTHAHNERGCLCLNLAAPFGRYENSQIEELWKLDPINVYVHGTPLDLEDEDVKNPFVNGHAKPVHARKMKRRI
jgi:hypothetical protein